MSKLDSITTATATPVRGDISPSLHPDSILPFGQTLATDDSPLTAAAFTAGRHALKALYETQAAMEQASLATRAKYGSGAVVDGSSIHAALPDDRAAQLAADLGDAFSRVARQFDLHVSNVTETIGTLTASIDRALQPKSRDAVTAQNLSDLRKFIADKPDGQRLDWVHQQIASGDLEVAHAVLGSNPFVSGMTREDQKLMRDLAAKTFALKEHAALTAATQMYEHLQKASQIFVARYKIIAPVVKPSAHAAAIANLKKSA